MESFAKVKLAEIDQEQNKDLYYNGFVCIYNPNTIDLNNYNENYLSNHRDLIKYIMLEDSIAFKLGDTHMLLDVNVEDFFYEEVAYYELIDEKHPDYEYCVETYKKLVR